MKKLLLFILLLTGIAVSSQAQRKFYYYPSSNVYYDISNRQYIYQEGGSWLPTALLPESIRSLIGPRYVVYNQTPEVWTQNETHIKKYKAPKMKNKTYGNGGGNHGNGKGKAKGHGKH